MRDKIDAKIITSAIRVFGMDHHYVFLNIWGSTSELHHQQVGTPHQRATRHSFNSRLFSDIFTFSEKAKNKVGPKLNCDLKKYSFPLRSNDKKIWPQSNTKQVSSVKSAAEMIVLYPIIDLLAADGILPLMKHHHKERGSVLIPFGPYLDDHRQPHQPGSIFLATLAYAHYGMNLPKDFNEVLRSLPLAASALFFRLPEKNYLPIGIADEFLKSPLAEMQRIVAKESRKGFDFYRSGGNCWCLKG